MNEAALGLAGKQTAIGDAITLAAKRMRENPSDSQVIVLLTDGENTAGTISPKIVYIAIILYGSIEKVHSPTCTCVNTCCNILTIC